MRKHNKIMAVAMLAIIPIFFAIGCKKEKECDKTDPNSTCYVPPVNPSPTKHTTTYTYIYGQPVKDLITKVIASADSSEVELVKIQSACDWSKAPPSSIKGIINLLDQEVFSKTNKVIGCDTINPMSINCLPDEFKIKVEDWGFTVVYGLPDRDNTKSLRYNRSVALQFGVVSSQRRKN